MSDLDKSHLQDDVAAEEHHAVLESVRVLQQVQEQDFGLAFLNRLVGRRHLVVQDRVQELPELAPLVAVSCQDNATVVSARPKSAYA